MRWVNDPFEPEQSVVPASGVIEGPLDELDESDDEGDIAAAESDDTTVVVFVPSEQADGQPTPETRVQLRYLEVGSLTLPVFTSIDQLIATCGSNQAWIGIPMEKIEEFRALVGADIALIDPELSTE